MLIVYSSFWLDWYPTLWLLNAGNPPRLSFLFDFGPIFKCHTQRMEKISCVSRGKILCWIFWKENHKKKFLEAHQALKILGVAISRKIQSRTVSSTYGGSFDHLKRKSYKSWSKNPYFVINTGQPVSATKSITLCWWSRRFIYFFLFYFSIVIDNAKPTYFDSVNSNIYSFILSLLKLYGIFSFMRWMHCIYLTLT